MATWKTSARSWLDFAPIAHNVTATATATKQANEMQMDRNHVMPNFVDPLDWA